MIRECLGSIIQLGDISSSALRCHVTFFRWVKKMKNCRTVFRRLLAVPPVLLTIVTACRDNAPMPTSPNPSGAVRSPIATGSVQSSDPLSKRLSSTPGACLVAVRAADGRYRSRSVVVALPKDVASGSVSTARFAYRGWARGVAEPVLLAVCNIPDAPSASAYFEKRFGGKSMNSAQLRSFAQSAGVAGAEKWSAAISPQLMQGAGPAYVTDGLASESPARKAAPSQGVTARKAASDGVRAMIVVDPGGCDPTAIIPEPGCPGYGDEEEYVPDQPPPPDGILSDYTFPFRPPLLPLPLPVIVCEGLTEDPHLSTTDFFKGRINGKGRTTCGPIPVGIAVSTVVYRQWCKFVLCVPVQITDIVTYSNPSATIAKAQADTACIWASGWYRGYSGHAASAYGITKTFQTASPWIGIKCAK